MLWFWPSEADSWCLTSRTTREKMCFTLKHPQMMLLSEGCQGLQRVKSWWREDCMTYHISWCLICLLLLPADPVNSGSVYAASWASCGQKLRGLNSRSSPYWLCCCCCSYILTELRKKLIGEKLLWVMSRPHHNSLSPGIQKEDRSNAWPSAIQLKW
jgi:hypothetical protein